jgi:hypothetical protein
MSMTKTQLEAALLVANARADKAEAIIADAPAPMTQAEAQASLQDGGMPRYIIRNATGSQLLVVTVAGQAAAKDWSGRALLKGTGDSILADEVQVGDIMTGCTVEVGVSRQSEKEVDAFGTTVTKHFASDDKQASSNGFRRNARSPSL